MESPIYPKLQIIIDILKNEVPDGSFDMNMGVDLYALSHCGSACCIGGHAQIEMAKRNLPYENMTHDTYQFFSPSCMHYALAALCDIPANVAHQICWPSGMCNQYDDYSDDFSFIGRMDAIAVLEKCRDTGIVDYSEFFGTLQ